MTLSDCIQGSLASQWRVLIVENDPKQRADQVENLRGWGYEVFVAEAQTDAEDAYQSLRADAIQKARAHHCHVVLVDQRLRSDASPDDISGVELAERTCTASFHYPEWLQETVIFGASHCSLVLCWQRRRP